MSEEQNRYGVDSPLSKIDIWSLGIVFYKLLTNRFPLGIDEIIQKSLVSINGIVWYMQELQKKQYHDLNAIGLEGLRSGFESKPQGIVEIRKLLFGMLKYNPQERWNSEQVLVQINHICKLYGLTLQEAIPNPRSSVSAQMAPQSLQTGPQSQPQNLPVGAPSDQQAKSASNEEQKEI